MKYIIYILVIIVVTGCLGASKSKQQPAVDSHKIDSLALMYKERGNAKDDAGDK